MERLILKLKLQYIGYLMRRADSLEKTDAGKDWRLEEKGASEDEMIGWHHWLNAHEFELSLEVGDGQAGLVCCSPWVHKELDMTEWLNLTDLCCGSAGKESACNVGDLDSAPGLGRSLGEGKGYPLQYYGPENSMDCIVHVVTKSQTWLSDFHFTSFQFLKIIFDREVILDSWRSGSRFQIDISISLNSGNFWAVFVQFNFKNIELGISKVSPHGLWILDCLWSGWPI